MNRSFDVTSLNTLANSCDRWQSVSHGDGDDSLLKAPRRRPSCSSGYAPSDSTSFLSSSDSNFDTDLEVGICHALGTAVDGTYDGSDTSGGPRVHRPTSAAKPPRRRVRFASRVEERQYAMTIGDSPSCHGPCPLTLDWRHSDDRRVPYNDDDDVVVDDGNVRRNRLRTVTYLSSNARRERVLRFISQRTWDRHQEELTRAFADEPGHSEKFVSPNRRRAVWPKDKCPQTLSSLPL